MKYATLIFFTEPIRIKFRVDMRQDAFLGWYKLRSPGGAEALDKKIVHGEELSVQMDNDEIRIGNEQAMYFATIPHAGEKTNVTAVCLDPIMRPPFEDMLMMVFEEFEVARSALCNAVSEPEYRRVLPELAQMCDANTVDSSGESLTRNLDLESNPQSIQQKAAIAPRDLIMMEEYASQFSFSYVNAREMISLDLDIDAYCQLTKAQDRVVSFRTFHNFGSPGILYGFDLADVEEAYEQRITVTDFLQAIEQEINLQELDFELAKGETFYKYWLTDNEGRRSAYVGIFDIDPDHNQTISPRCLKGGLSFNPPDEDDTANLFWANVSQSLLKLIDRRLILRAARLVEEQGASNAFDPTDVLKPTTIDRSEPISLQRKPHGRPPEPWNDEAFKIILEGDFSQEAHQAAFKYWYEKKEIPKPGRHDRNAFKKAMQRAKDRYLRRAEMGRKGMK